MVERRPSRQWRGVLAALGAAAAAAVCVDYVTAGGLSSRLRWLLGERADAGLVAGDGFESGCRLASTAATRGAGGAADPDEAWLLRSDTALRQESEGDFADAVALEDDGSSRHGPGVPLECLSDDTPDGRGGAGSGSGSGTGSGAGQQRTPDFFQSTKFFACLELEESKELFDAVSWRELRPAEVLFRRGDQSEDGIYVVTEGSLGVFISDDDAVSALGEAAQRRQTPPAQSPMQGAAGGDGDSDWVGLQLVNTLNSGESVGDLDVIDGARRSVTCIAGEQGAVLLCVSRDLFLRFVHDKPVTLEVYLRQGIARLWRVAYYVLAQHLTLPDSLVPDLVPLHGPPEAASFLSRLPWLQWAISSHTAHNGTSAAGPAQPQAAAYPAAATAPSAGVSTSSGAFGGAASSMGPAPAPFAGGVAARDSGGGEPSIPFPRADAVDVSRPEVLEEMRRNLLHSPLVRRVQLRSGATLYNEDDPSDAFFVVLAGKVVVELPAAASLRSDSRARLTQTSATAYNGMAVIGAACYLSQMKHTDTVRTVDSCLVAVFGAEDLERLLEHNAQLFIQLNLIAARAFAPLIRRFISLGLNRVWLNSGDVAYERGQPANSLFILISGHVRLIRPQPPQSATRRYDGDRVADDGAGGAACPSGGTDGALAGAMRAERQRGVTEDVVRGGTMGESSLLSNSAHDHTALCIRDSELVRMSRPSFERVLRESPSVVSRVVDSLARRLRSAARAPLGGDSGRLVPHGTPELVTITLFPADANFDLQAISDALCHALRMFGPTLQLSSHDVAMQFNDATAAKLSVPFYRSKLTAWMASQEEIYRFIVLQGDPLSSAWTSLAISQADVVLVVAGGASPHSGVQAHERRLLWERAEQLQRRHHQVFVRAELLLLHWPAASGGRFHAPRGTARWLEQRPGLFRHHHVRMGMDGDVARVARHLAGCATGLVLSGGGSRGLAHLGVIRALEDAGIPIDFVGGTSQGAFMGALFCKHLSSRSMLPVVRDFATKLASVRNLLTDLTLPLLSVFHGAGFSRAIRQAMGDVNIEDLWVPMFLVCTNLTKGDISVHERGSLWRYVRASMTLVGLLPPMYDNGCLLVDGGYVDDVPVDLMRRTGVQTVIVVDVENKENQLEGVMPYDGNLSGWWLLLEYVRSSLWRRSHRVPRKGAITDALSYISHMRQLASVRREYPDAIDLYLQPPGISDYSLMDYGRMEEIVRKAYKYGWTAIADWRQQRNLSTAAAPLGFAGLNRKRPYGRSTSTSCMAMLVEAAPRQQPARAGETGHGGKPPQPRPSPIQGQAAGAEGANPLGSGGGAAVGKVLPSMHTIDEAPPTTVVRRSRSLS